MFSNADTDDDLTNLAWLSSVTIFPNSIEASSPNFVQNSIASPSSPSPKKRSHQSMPSATAGELVVAKKSLPPPSSPSSSASPRPSGSQPQQQGVKKLLVHHKTNVSKLAEEHQRLKEEKDYKNDPQQRPPFSYAALICLAMSEQRKKMSLSQIYKWIKDNFAFYRGSDKSWQNSIRHNLSLNKCFTKVARSKGEPGKGGFWTLNSNYHDQHTHRGGAVLGQVDEGTLGDGCPKKKRKKRRCRSSNEEAATTSKIRLKVYEERQQVQNRPTQPLSPLPPPDASPAIKSALRALNNCNGNSNQFPPAHMDNGALQLSDVMSLVNYQLPPQNINNQFQTTPSSLQRDECSNGSNNEFYANLVHTTPTPAYLEEEFFVDDSATLDLPLCANFETMAPAAQAPLQHAAAAAAAAQHSSSAHNVAYHIGPEWLGAKCVAAAPRAAHHHQDVPMEHSWENTPGNLLESALDLEGLMDLDAVAK